MVNLYKSSIFPITKTQIAIQNQVIQQPKSTERQHMNATIMRSLNKNMFTFTAVGVGRTRWSGLGDACQSGEMGTLLESLF